MTDGYVPSPRSGATSNLAAFQPALIVTGGGDFCFKWFESFESAHKKIYLSDVSFSYALY